MLDDDPILGPANVFPLQPERLASAEPGQRTEGEEDLPLARRRVDESRDLIIRELMDGYAWCYQRSFSLASIWRRRPAAWSQVMPYPAMSVLYKKRNWFWPLLIRWRVTHAAW